MITRYLLLAGFVLCGPAQADDITVATTIEAVTVYLEGASIQRGGAATLPAGEHQLIIAGLPADMDTDVARLSLSSSAVDIGAVQFVRKTTSALVNEAERAQQRKVDALALTLAAIEDDIETARLQLKIVEGMAKGGDHDAEPPVTGSNLATALAAAGSGAQAARARIREGAVRQREAQAQLAAAQADLNKIRSGNRASTEVRAFVRAGAATGPVRVMLEYRSRSAGWEPSYAARVDTPTSTLELIEQAQVVQNSGEDWSGVRLTLSSAEPSSELEVPDVSSTFLDLESPQPEGRMLAAPAPPAATAMKLEEIVVTNQGRRVDKARITTQGIIVSYAVPGRVDLATAREPRLFPISEQSWPVQLTTTVAPETDLTAYVIARFRNDRDTPIRAGDLQVYRDGAYVGATELETVLPGDDARLPLGADERIRIQARQEEEKSGKRGTIGRKRVAETRMRYDITSFHPAPVTLDVLASRPVPRNREIEVETLPGATPPTQSDVDGKAGVLRWRLTLAPEKPQTVRHAYAVRYPDGQILTQETGEE